ncbi:MAG: hypothetical protein MRY32_05080, partial [Rickettsiales bacterium]|nr:hypothetical protein [Rickettsiales bacterium]
MKPSHLCICLIGLIALPVLAFASSPLGNVGTAVVNDGAISYEARIGYTEDNDSTANDQRIQLREHIDVGLNDWYAFRLVAVQDKRHGDNLEHAAAILENRIQLIERRESGWDGGVRLIYVHRDGDKTPHEIDLRWMMQVPFGDGWEWRHNTVLEHDIGEN